MKEKYKTWWEKQIDMHSTLVDLEWLIYNWDWEFEDSDGMKEGESDNFGSMSEQVWAIKQGLADEIEN